MFYHIKGYAVEINKKDIHIMYKHNWQPDDRPRYRTPHIKATINGKKTSLHRLLMGEPKGKVVDHIDGNALNNKRSNLRICTHKQNMRNKKKTNKGSSSQYKGVTFHKKSQKWRANITIKKVKYLGQFDSEVQAAKKYNEAAIKYYGEFARLNVINNRRSRNVK